MEALFREISQHVALALEAISVLMIAIGAVEALGKILIPLFRRDDSQGRRRAAWLSLARWLLLGLEFMLAADIVRTAIAPTWDDIGMLAAIAVIRTFLNYFLERDLEHAAEIADADAEPAGPEFVRWVRLGGEPIGLVAPEGLLEQARKLLTEQRIEGGTMPWPTILSNDNTRVFDGLTTRSYIS